MNKYLLLFCLLPLVGISQSKKKNKKETEVVSQSSEGYSINGTANGFAEGTTVDLLNANSKQVEASGKVSGGKFTLAGKIVYPDVKLLSFDKKYNEFVPIFLDNSRVEVTVTNGALNQSVVSGSKSNNEFVEYNRIIQPYERLFAEGPEQDPAGAKKCIEQLESFLKKYPASFVGPFAIYQIHRLNEDGAQMERLFNSLSSEVKASPNGGYIGLQVETYKKDPMGKKIADFSQQDTEGNMVSISSFKGKYVLVDFWASWCGPCRNENPNVVSAYNKYKSKNFTVLGVSLDKEKSAWLKAINADGLAWKNVSDLKGWSNAVAQQFGIQSIPQNYLIDPNGIVIGKNLRGAALEAKLEAVLK